MHAQHIAAHVTVVVEALSRQSPASTYRNWFTLILEREKVTVSPFEAIVRVPHELRTRFSVKPPRFGPSYAPCLRPPTFTPA